MRIKIVENKKTRINLWLPLSFLKSRIFYNGIASHLEEGSFQNDNETEQTDGNSKPTLTYEQYKQIYQMLHNYIKAHGHFTVVDVNVDKGNTKVKITV